MIVKLLPIALLAFTSCGGAPVEADRPTGQASIVPLSQIDLSQIGPVPPKGRIQEHTNLTVVQNLIAHGNEAIPFLIGKLEDETKVRGHVFDYWSDVRVGDVAFVILTNFFTDTTGQQTSLPAAAYDAFLQRENPDLTAEQVLRDYIAKHGRRKIANRWRELWSQYQGRVLWDQRDRCFKLKSS